MNAKGQGSENADTGNTSIGEKNTSWRDISCDVMYTWRVT